MLQTPVRGHSSACHRSTIASDPIARIPVAPSEQRTALDRGKSTRPPCNARLRLARNRKWHQSRHLGFHAAPRRKPLLLRGSEPPLPQDAEPPQNASSRPLPPSTSDNAGVPLLERRCAPRRPDTLGETKSWSRLAAS